MRGFTVVDGRKADNAEWNSITQIDVGRKPTGIVEWFYVVLFADGRALTVVHDAKGFIEFSEAIFERWPEIKDSWTKVFMGYPDVAEYKTLWKRE
jgi:hypothetical protein